MNKSFVLLGVKEKRGVGKQHMSVMMHGFALEKCNNSIFTVSQKHFSPLLNSRNKVSYNRISIIECYERNYANLYRWKTD